MQGFGAFGGLDIQPHVAAVLALADLQAEGGKGGLHVAAQGDVGQFAGAEDRRAPPAQSEIMVDSIKGAGKENLVESFYIQPGEAHGFYKVENNVKLYDTFMSFFDKHIGAKAKAADDNAGDDKTTGL